MIATPTRFIKSLPVLAPTEADDLGFVSISTMCHSIFEESIMESMARDRNPERSAWIEHGPNLYELAVKREDYKTLD
jgi:hypothetical protein